MPRVAAAWILNEVRMRHAGVDCPRLGTILPFAGDHVPHSGFLTRGIHLVAGLETHLAGVGPSLDLVRNRLLSLALQRLIKTSPGDILNRCQGADEAGYFDAFQLCPSDVGQ